VVYGERYRDNNCIGLWQVEQAFSMATQALDDVQSRWNWLEGSAAEPPKD